MEVEATFFTLEAGSEDVFVALVITASEGSRSLLVDRLLQGSGKRPLVESSKTCVD